MQRACIHLGDYCYHVKVGDYCYHVKVGDYCYHVKVGDYRYICKKIDALIKEYLGMALQIHFSNIVMKANKDLFGEYLLCNEDDPPRVLSLEELKSLF